MADISRYPGVRHLRAAPTEHIIQQRRGRTVRSAAGATFWFRPLTSTLSQVPVDDRELPLLVHARTVDFQDVTVQATVSYRCADPEAAARRIDFSLDVATGRWRSTPLDQIAQLLTELAGQQATDLVAELTLERVLRGGEEGGIALIRRRMLDGLTTDARLPGLGLDVADARVVAVRPEPDVERALQTPARELLQQEADRATSERRALAVQREQAIGENELAARIELATREERLVIQQGANERRRVDEEAAAEAIKARGRAEASRMLTEAEAAAARTMGEAKAEATRAMGEAEAAAEAARVAAVTGVDPQVLAMMALRELAAGLPRIGNLTITPDLLAPVLARLAGSGE